MIKCAHRPGVMTKRRHFSIWLTRSSQLEGGLSRRCRHASYGFQSALERLRLLRTLTFSGHCKAETERQLGLREQDRADLLAHREQDRHDHLIRHEQDRLNLLTGREQDRLDRALNMQLDTIVHALERLEFTPEIVFAFSSPAEASREALADRKREAA